MYPYLHIYSFFFSRSLFLLSLQKITYLFWCVYSISLSLSLSHTFVFFAFHLLSFLSLCQTYMTLYYFLLLDAFWLSVPSLLSLPWNRPVFSYASLALFFKGRSWSLSINYDISTCLLYASFCIEISNLRCCSFTDVNQSTQNQRTVSQKEKRKDKHKASKYPTCWWSGLVSHCKLPLRQLAVWHQPHYSVAVALKIYVHKHTRINLIQIHTRTHIYAHIYMHTYICTYDHTRN